MNIRWDNIRTLIVDAHVHIYPCFDVPKLFSNAAENFAVQKKEVGHADACLAVMLLSESNAQDWFNENYQLCVESQDFSHNLEGWKLSIIENDRCALLATGSRQQQLLLIKGYQIISMENLELLTLCVEKRIEDGLPIEEIINQASQLDAITVLPWAVGKWLGNRGSIIQKMLEKYHDQIFAGDNSGRPWFWFSDARLKFAKQSAVSILNGSDPLPIDGQEQKIGSFGLSLPKCEIEATATEIIKSSLRSSRGQIISYGSLESINNFIINQFKLRF